MRTTPRDYVAVVDDDESLRRSVGRLLRAAGIEAVMYHSAEAFLDDAKRPQFDCLLLDVQLGGMSGIELNRHLSAAGSTTPIIYITAYHEPEIREQALRTPCVAYFSKAEPAAGLLDTIRKAISLQHNSTRRAVQS